MQENTSSVNVRRFKFKYLKPASNILIFSKDSTIIINNVLAGIIRAHSINNPDSTPDILPLIFYRYNNYTYTHDDPYRKIVPPYMTHDMYNEDILLSFIDKQEKRMQLDRNKSGIVVFDDCFYNDDFWNNFAIKQLIFYSKYSNISPIFILRYPVETPEICRRSFNYIMIDAGYDRLNNLKLLRGYGFYNVYHNFDTFLAVYQYITNPTCCPRETHDSKKSRKIVFQYLKDIIGSNVSRLIAYDYVEKSYSTYTGIIYSCENTGDVNNNNVRWYSLCTAKSPEFHNTSRALNE